MFELLKKRRELNRVYKVYDEQIKKAKKEKKNHEEDQLISEMFSETGAIEEEIKALISRKWVQTAEELFLPVPSYDEDSWEKGDYTRKRFLTPSGITKLRGLIREEKSARRKAILEWVTPFIGVIGALTGLLAVILR